MSACVSCDLVARRDAGEAPSWDRIVRAPDWDVAHATGTAIEGWLVLVLRRHVDALAALTDDEAASLGPLIKATSAALHETTGCIKTYVAQFAEHPQHRHVHVHVIPRFSEQSEDRRGPAVFSQLGVSDDRAVGEERMTDLANALRPLLQRFEADLVARDRHALE